MEDDHRDVLAAMVRSKATGRWSEREISAATRRARGEVAQAREIIDDPDRERRLLRGRCAPCHYIDRRIDDGNATHVCKNCGLIALDAVICPQCSKELGLCTACGGDIALEMRPRAG